MTTIEMTAWETRAGVALSQPQAAELNRLKLVDVMPEPDGERWQLRSNSRIGIATGGGWELRVAPKILVPKLFFLLGYAMDPNGWKDEDARFDSEPTLMHAIASGFAWHATQALRGGVIHGYRTFDDRLAAMRGRIRFGDQIARGGGLPLPVEVSYDDYTADVLENQLLKTAATALLRLPRIQPLARRRLLHLRVLLDNVSLIARPREVRAPLITRLNERYDSAMRLAELILHASSVDAGTGRVHATAFVFDMNKVFEDFLTVALTDAMRRYGGTIEPQSTGITLDEDDRITLKPDLIWRTGGECRAILDAKYKAIDSGVLKHGDAYQMLAYCTAYNMNRGFLVYAKDSDVVPTRHVIRNAGTEIVVTTVDLEAEPEQVLARVDEIAAMIVAEPVEQHV